MNWKTRTYIIGGLAGTVIGILSSYLLARAVEEDPDTEDKVQIPTRTMLSLALAVVSLIRQIAEASKPDKK